MTHGEQALLFITLACSVDISPIMRKVLGDKLALVVALFLKWMLFMVSLVHLAKALWV